MFTQQDLDVLMAEHPRLNDFGLGNFDPDRLTKDEASTELEKNRAALRNSLGRVNVAALWIAQHEAAIRKCGKKCKFFAPQVPFRSSYITSYGWKHNMQRDIDEYVTNGVFIAACMLAEIPYREKPDNPNIYFNRVERLQ